MPFARWESFGDCVIEQKQLGHDEESAGAICHSIEERAQKGILYKADTIGLEILSKADEESLVVGGFASYEIEDDDGDTITVDAQVKALHRFFSMPPEYQAITVNHKEFKIGQPTLKYVNSKGESYYSHVNEKGTYLISTIRNDNLKTTMFYREQVRKGNMTGYSITGLPLEKGETPKIITDLEYHAVTLVEKGVMKAVNPKTREVKVISKSGIPKTDSERAINHFGFTLEQWNSLSEEQKQIFVDKLPPHGTGQQLDNNKVEKAKKHVAIKEAARVGQTTQKADVSAESILEKYGFDSFNKAKKR